MTSRREGDDLVISLDGDLELATIAPVAAELQRAESSDWRRLVVDLRELSFLDSTGINLLTTAHARCCGAGRSFSVMSSDGPVKRVLEVCGVLAILSGTEAGGVPA